MLQIAHSFSSQAAMDRLDEEDLVSFNSSKIAVGIFVLTIETYPLVFMILHRRKKCQCFDPLLFFSD